MAQQEAPMTRKRGVRCATYDPRYRRIFIGVLSVVKRWALRVSAFRVCCGQTGAHDSCLANNGRATWHDQSRERNDDTQVPVSPV